MKSKLDELYPDALLAISPLADDNRRMLIQGNYANALCYCTIVLAHQLEQLTRAIQNLDIQKS